MNTRTRAAQIASMAKAKFSELGQLPTKKHDGPHCEKETPEQLAKRKELRAKLWSFVD